MTETIALPHGIEASEPFCDHDSFDDHDQIRHDNSCDHENTPRQWVDKYCSNLDKGFVDPDGNLRRTKQATVRQALMAIRNGDFPRMVKGWTQRDLDEHCRGIQTLYATATYKRMMAIAFDIDCKARGSLEGAIAYAQMLRDEHFPNLYFEDSTNGGGVHCWIIFDSHGHDTSEVKDVLLRRLCPYLNKLAVGFDVEFVEIKCTPMVVKWDRFGEVVLEDRNDDDEVYDADDIAFMSEFATVNSQAVTQGGLCRLPRKGLVKGSDDFIALKNTTVLTFDDVAKLPYVPDYNPISKGREVTVERPKLSHDTAIVGETPQAIANSYDRQSKALMQYARNIGRVPSLDEALSFIHDNQLFTGEWHDNEAKRRERVEYILRFIEQGFDPARCRKEQVFYVGQYDEFAMEICPDGWRDVEEEQRVKSVELTEFGERIVTKRAKYQGVCKWQQVSLVLSTFHHALVRFPNEDGSLPQNWAKEMWAIANDHDVLSTKWKTDRWMIITNRLIELGLVSKSGVWSEGKAQIWQLGSKFPEGQEAHHAIDLKGLEN